MTSQRGWREGKRRYLWFVSGDGQLWLSTARIVKRNAIAAWLQGDDRKTWKYWYGRGYRAVRAKIKFKVLP